MGVSFVKDNVEISVGEKDKRLEDQPTVTFTRYF